MADMRSSPAAALGTASHATPMRSKASVSWRRTVGLSSTTSTWTRGAEGRCGTCGGTGAASRTGGPPADPGCPATGRDGAWRAWAAGPAPAGPGAGFPSTRRRGSSGDPDGNAPGRAGVRTAGAAGAVPGGACGGDRGAAGAGATPGATVDTTAAAACAGAVAGTPGPDRLAPETAPATVVAGALEPGAGETGAAAGPGESAGARAFAGSTPIGRVSGSTSSSSTTRFRIGSSWRVSRSMEMAYLEELGAPRGTAATTGTPAPSVRIRASARRPSASTVLTMRISTDSNEPVGTNSNAYRLYWLCRKTISISRASRGSSPAAATRYRGLSIIASRPDAVCRLPSPDCGPPGDLMKARGVPSGAHARIAPTAGGPQPSAGGRHASIGRKEPAP